MSNEPKPKIGFIGTGYMGGRMASRLLDAGYPLIVCNRTPEKMQPLVQKGAEAAVSPKNLAAKSDVVITMLTTDAVVKDLVLGPDGVLAGAEKGTTLIEMSTVLPATSREVFDAAKAKGVKMIDSPVSGSTPQAEQGILVIFVGGEEDVYQECKPILDVLSRESVFMGPSGSGAMMKLVVNILLGLGMQAIAEAIVLGEKAGLDKEKLIDVLGQTAVISPNHKLKLANAKNNQYPVTFPLRLMYKDYGLILRQAAKLSVPMPTTAVAQQLCAIEQAKGIEEDFSSVIKLMRQISG